jgi:hypothetical protein
MYLHLNCVVIYHRKIIWKKAEREKEQKLATKNSYVWIAHDLINVTSSSNGCNSNPPVRDMTWSLTVASAIN